MLCMTFTLFFPKKIESTTIKRKRRCVVKGEPFGLSKLTTNRLKLDRITELVNRALLALLCAALSDRIMFHSVTASCFIQLFKSSSTESQRSSGSYRSYYLYLPREVPIV